MPGSQDESPGDDYFNDLSQQPPRNADSGERRESQDESGQVPKPKRIACVLCRKRKLRCDGTKPSCGTCTRLQHDCSYDEVRKKSGPKRGYVKLLEARLAQVETLLKTQDEHPPPRNKNVVAIVPTPGANGSFTMNGDLSHLEAIGVPNDLTNTLGTNGPIDLGMPGDEPFPWEMIGLGLDEPLPTQDIVDELNNSYFEKVHPSLPMIHRARFYAAMNLAPNMRPPVCLRYAMWAVAATVLDKYESLHEHFYLRARKYIQQDEMKGHGESLITIAHCQTWVLLGTYEFKQMYFPRAWMSSGRASRMAMMMGLHRLDGAGLDVKQCVAPPKDWTEREERRRTFWMTFCIDRYSSIGTGWPMSIEESDIQTQLPADEEAFELNKPQKTIELHEALEPAGPQKLASFSGVVVLACLFGRNLTHLHRPRRNDQDNDLNGEFWRRHRAMDNILSNTSLALPDHLRLPSGLNNSNIVFLNMSLHTSTICLHQAAIFKADQNKMPTRISAESKVRCITAAAEIASIMRQISHLNLAAMNPFISFCLYVAARVFVQYLKSRPKDSPVSASLEFLLLAMHAIKRKNPLTESFLVQLDVDLVGAGLESIRAYQPQDAPSKTPTCQMMESNARRKAGTGETATMNHFTSDKTHNCTAVPTASGHVEYPDMSANGSFMPSNAPTFELASRQRSPGSSTNHHSPTTLNQEMDTSPDGSGSADQRTPGSSVQSGHNTSQSSFSPSTFDPSSSLGIQHAPSAQHATTPSTAIHPNGDQITAMFDPTFTDDFNMHNFAHVTANGHDGAFGLWNNQSTGLTPGASTGLMATPNTMGEGATGIADEWTQVMNNFPTWYADTGQEQAAVQEVMNRRV